MVNVLIRNIDDDDLARLDELAARAGLSRNEFLVRHLRQAARSTPTVTREDLKRLADLASGLDDEALMRDAWS